MRSSSTSVATRWPRASGTSRTCSTSSSSVTRGRTGWCCCRATTASRLRSVPNASQPPRRRSAASTRWRAAPMASPRLPYPIAPSSMRSVSGWTTTSTRPVRWRRCSALSPQRTPPWTPATTQGRSSLRCARCSVPSGWCPISAVTYPQMSPPGQGLRRRRRDPSGAAGGRMGGRNHQGRHHRPPLTPIARLPQPPFRRPGERLPARRGGHRRRARRHGGRLVVRRSRPR
jgi:hypothetical protein